MKKKVPAKKNGSRDYLPLDSRSGMSDSIPLFPNETVVLWRPESHVPLKFYGQQVVTRCITPIRINHIDRTVMAKQIRSKNILKVDTFTLPFILSLAS